MPDELLKWVTAGLTLMEEITKHPRKLIYILVLLLFAAGFLMILALGFEALTGINYNRSVTEKTALLKTLNDLEKDGVKTRPELAVVYAQIVAEVTAINPRPVLLLFPTIMIDEILFFKALSGSLIGIVFFILALFYRSLPGRRAILIGSILVTFAFGILGALLPTFSYPIINYLGLPILELILLILFGGKRPAKDATDLTPQVAQRR